MLPLAMVEEVRRLLDEGEHSQRKIAEQLGVSRGTVNAIANGKRGLFGREADADPDVCAFDQPAERCTGCGGMVHKPCVLCRTRRYVGERRNLREARTRRRVA